MSLRFIKKTVCSNIMFYYSLRKILSFIAKRFNALSILYIYMELTEKIDLVQMGNKFARKNEERKIFFGKFSNEDWKA